MLEYPTGYDVTMFCEVNIGDPTLANSTNVTWSVPSSQKVSSQPQVLDDGNKLNASLTLRNITEDDRGLYNVTFLNMCGSVSCQLSLSITPATCSKGPDPVQNITINVPQDASTLVLAANFSDTDQSHLMVIWSKSSTSNRGNYGGKYRTEHQVVSHCLFTEKLIIHNVSVSDAGLYFVKVFDGLDTDMNTTFHVNIVNQGDTKERKRAKVSVLCVSFCGSFNCSYAMCGRRYHIPQAMPKEVEKKERTVSMKYSMEWIYTHN